ncbi:MAG TPA: biotin/lipoyl-containing protein [Candidatus Binataceae bacterium]|nr:biotin/lipoyl-containing protein [Candidatus Binataceae bacterium]
MKLKRQGDAREFEVELLVRNTQKNQDGQDDTDADGTRAVRIKIDGRELAATVAAMPDGSAMVELGGRRVRVAGARRRSSIAVAAGPYAAEFVMVEGRMAHRAGGLAAPEVDAPMPGKVLKVLVAEGQPVEQGDPLIVLEAMKMETTLYAESPAIVAKICVVAGQMVDHGARLVELSPAAIPARPPESPPRDD